MFYYTYYIICVIRDFALRLIRPEMVAAPANGSNDDYDYNKKKK